MSTISVIPVQMDPSGELWGRMWVARGAVQILCHKRWLGCSGRPGRVPDPLRSWTAAGDVAAPTLSFWPLLQVCCQRPAAVQRWARSCQPRNLCLHLTCAGHSWDFRLYKWLKNLRLYITGSTTGRPFLKGQAGCLAL
jgi:hypothetical protein